MSSESSPEDDEDDPEDELEDPEEDEELPEAAEDDAELEARFGGIWFTSDRSRSGSDVKKVLGFLF